MTQNTFRWTLLKQALLKKKGKALLIVLASAMGASVVAALLNLEADLRYRMNHELRDYGPNIILLPDEKSRNHHLDQSLLSSLSEVGSNLLAFTPQLFVPIKIMGQQTVMVGTDIVALRKLYPNWDWQTGPAVEAPVFAGVALARRLRIKIGSKIRIEVSGQKSERTVAGLIESGEAEDDQIFVDLSYAQAVSQNEGRFHIVALSVLGELSNVERQFREFVTDRQGIAFQVIRKIAVAETLILDKISKLMALVFFIIFAILFFCINTTVSAILLSRQGEIALLRVLGARRREIMLGLTLELITLGLVGGFLGFLMGMTMAQVLGKILFQSLIRPRFSIFLLTILSSLAMMLISSILPIRRAINRQAALVLKEA